MRLLDRGKFVFSFSLITAGLLITGVSIFFILFLEINNLADFLIFLTIFSIGFGLYRVGTKLYDRLGSSNDNSTYDESINLIAMDIFIVGDKLRITIKHLIRATSILSSVTMIIGIVFISLFFDESDPGYVLFGSFLLILSLLLIYLSLRLRNDHTKLKLAISPLQDQLETKL